MRGIKHFFSKLLVIAIIFSITIFPVAAKSDLVHDLQYQDESQYVCSEDIEFTFDINEGVLSDVDVSNLSSFSSKSEEVTIVINELNDYNLNEDEASPLFCDEEFYLDSGAIDHLLYPEVSLRAALPDLITSSLTTKSDSQPFMTGTPVEFLFNAANSSGVKVDDVILTVYLDDSIKSYNIGTLAPWTGKRMSVEIGGIQAGKHVFQATINPDRRVVESNYSNNTVEGNFEWRSSGFSTLCAYALGTSDGSTSYPVMAQKTYAYSVANFGKTALSNVEFQFSIGGQKQNMLSIPSLPSGQQYSGTFSLKFRNKGNWTVGMDVDPNKKQIDTDRSDNTIQATYNVTYDTHYIFKPWQNPSSIGIVIAENVVEMIDETNLEECIEWWNGITSKVKLKDFSYTTEEAVRPQTGKVLFVAVESLTNDAIADTSNGSSGAYSTYSVIRVYKNVFPNIGATLGTQLERQKKTISHEMGHALGLAHPFTNAENYLTTECADKAIMWQFAQPQRVSLTLTGHDEWNLQKLYP